MQFFTATRNDLFYTLLFSGFLFFCIATYPRSNDSNLDVSTWIEPVNMSNFDIDSLSDLSQTIPDFSKVNWNKTIFPYVETIPPYRILSDESTYRRVWCNIDIDKSKLENSGHALYITRIMGGPYSVYINDKLIFFNDYDWRMQWNHPIAIDIPMNIATEHEAVNIKIAVPFNTELGFAVGSIYFDDKNTVNRWKSAREFLQMYIPSGLSTIFFVLGLIALVFYFSGIDKAENGLFFLVSLTCFTGSLQFFIDFDNQIISVVYGHLVDALSCLFGCIIGIYILYLTKSKYLPICTKFIMAYGIVMIAITMPIWGFRASALQFQHYLNACVCMVLASLCSYESFKLKNFDARILSAFYWITLTFLFHDVMFLTSHAKPDDIWIFPYSATIIILIFLQILIKRYIQNNRKVLAANAELKEKLNEQETLLMENQRRIRAYEIDSIAINLHDSLGHSLSMALATAESQEDTSLIEILQDSIYELQIAVLSIQRDDNNVLPYLHTYRDKSKSRFKKLKREFHWNTDGFLENIKGRVKIKSSHYLLLSISEIITNALKHSCCTSISIYISHSNSGILSITVSDNGIGFDVNETTKSVGLNKMDSRMKELNGRYHINSNCHGTTVTIHVPFELIDSDIIRNPSEKKMSDVAT